MAMPVRARGPHNMKAEGRTLWAAHVGREAERKTNPGSRACADLQGSPVKRL